MESCDPKPIYPDSESPWKSASFDILLNEQKNSDGVLVGSTMRKKCAKIIGNHVKVLKLHLYLTIFMMIAQYNSKTDSIFGLSVKNYIDSHTFREKNFSVENWPLGDLRHCLMRKKVEDGYRSIFDGKNFFAKCIWIDVIFHAESEYTICFAIILSYHVENRQI